MHGIVAVALENFAVNRLVMFDISFRAVDNVAVKIGVRGRIIGPAQANPITAGADCKFLRWRRRLGNVIA